MMEICRRCIIPASFPSITFSNGICNFCRDYEKLIDTEIVKGPGRLREILKSKKTGSYDCVVPVSGGKDSSYVLFYAVRELGLKVLALFFDSGFSNELSKENVKKMCRKLSVDLVVVKSTDFRRKAVREALCISKYVNRFLLGICGNCENNLRTAAINEATKREIAFILWGSTRGEAASKEYKKTRRFRRVRTFGEEILMLEGKKTIKPLIDYILGFGVIFNCRKIADFIRTLMHKFKHNLYIILDNIASKAPEGWRKFKPLVLQVSFENKKVQTIFFYDYVPNNPFKQIEILKRELAWKSPSDRETRLDCKLHCFQQYDYLRRTGITMDGFYLANLVRKGALSRADAIKKEEKIKKDLTRECLNTLRELGFNYNFIDNYNVYARAAR